MNPWEKEEVETKMALCTISLTLDTLVLVELYIINNSIVDGRLAPVSSKQVKWMKKRIYIKTKIEAIQKQMDTRAKHKGAYGI